ncbi:MAG: diaminopimelate epimerase [Chloroflexota bacterium]|nr:diaminopimelate epimerase [Chloroflexota bacterium]
MNIKFEKLHGAGNDYIAIDGRGIDIDWGKLSFQMSQPHFGVFSDGIVVLKNSEKANAKIKIFNPDGSEAEMSGNGVRLFSKFVLDNKLVDFDGKALTVETGGGVREVFPIFENGEMISAKIAMGKPKFLRDEIPVSNEIFETNSDVDDLVLNLKKSIAVSCVNIGNPHAVFITDEDVDKFELSSIGPLVENNKAFPNRINFEIVNIISRNEIKARIFERGAGETLSSGTGTSACAIIGIKKKLLDNNVKVNVPGGHLNISWVPGDESYLEGPTERVFTGNWKIKE